MSIYNKVANILSASRLIVPVVLFFPYDWTIATRILITMVIFSTDFIDGYIARKGEETKLGHWLDHIADKVVVFSLAIFLWSNELFYWQVIFIALLLEFAIIILSVFISHLNGKRMIITKAGKFKMLAYCLGTFFIYLNNINPAFIFETFAFVSFVTGLFLAFLVSCIYTGKIFQMIILGEDKKR